MADDLARLHATATQFVEWDVNPETRAEATRLLAGIYPVELDDPYGREQRIEPAIAAFASRLEFGTAGLRGEMGCGFARMNDLTVVQAAQGFAAYLAATVPASTLATAGVVVGFDHRARGSLNSGRFAALTAIACTAKGIRVHLYHKLVATPLVPYAIKKLRACGGVMVTASHNPKADNGYKVYAGNGAQIIAPVDAAIARAIRENEAPWPACRALYEGIASPAAFAAHAARTPALAALYADPTDAMIPAYIADITAALKPVGGGGAGAGAGAAGTAAASGATTPLTIAYTAMHGVGTPFAAAMFESFGLPPFIPTPEQVTPDPDFPMVAFPNPEEGKGALALAMKTADSARARVILANDPDADRLAVAERSSGGSGDWYVFTGNEIGALLAHWCYRRYVAGGGEPSKAVMVASTVSSKLLGRMGAVEGFTFEETLTGFKWMGNAMQRHEDAGRTVVFSFEEAIGFACSSTVRDKDGVSAAAVMATMAHELAREGKTLWDQLQAIYARYGLFVTLNGYVFAGPADINDVFKRLRADGHYWLRLGDLVVTAVRDLTGTGWDSEAAGGRPTLPTSTSSHMITYKFSNGVVATLRTSGTEPKLKYYTEGSGAPGADPRATRDELARTVALILEEMIEKTRRHLRGPGEA